MPESPTLVRTRLTGLSRPLDRINQFERAIEDCTSWHRVSGPPWVPGIKFVARFVRFVGLVTDRVLHLLPIPFPKRNYLSIGYLASHYLIYKTFPYFSVPSGLRIVWIYDAWQNQLDAIASALRVHRINVAFISSLQASQYFNTLDLQNFKSYWLPEAVTISDYQPKPYSERKIDVLQMGRRWDDYHFQIEQVCRENSWTYLYEEGPGKNIFPTRQAFLEGLADAKISICVPSAITHPARSGIISTVTWRYFESMAAKCLILGKVPDEMRQLFDYEPIIDIDMANPGVQLEEVLAEYSSYIPLIERNYTFVQRHHQWRNRIELMQKYIADFEGKACSCSGRGF